MKVRDLLKIKGDQVITINEEKESVEALAKLIHHGVGSLVVTAPDGSISGILSERDILRQVHAGNGSLAQCKVRKLMTPKDKLIVGTDDDDLDYVMTVMTNNRIRHLPIIKEGKLAGVISIGDIVKSQLSAMKHENKMLENYITGSYPA
ncbi:MAG: CBS domain-containing protein [Lentisphaerae bacterium]|nr:CBS domain-containing protein [Lentisphaerota bacterium]